MPAGKPPLTTSWASGKEGAHPIGVFVAEDEITNLLLPGAESSRLPSLEEDNVSAVVRYRRDLGRNSTVGMLITSRQGDACDA